MVEGQTAVTGTHGAVTAGHYLATAAGLRILQDGGNAIDAAAAVSFCLNVLEPHQNGIGGEVPVLVSCARERKVYAISGMGWSPAAFTIEWCREHGIHLIPGDGYLPACVPATVGTWALALSRFGTMSLSEVLHAAIELAESGFPVYEDLHNHIASNIQRYTEKYPTTGDVFLPGGKVPEVGDILLNPDLAKTLRRMCDAEKGAASKGREAGIQAGCDEFYKGEIARRIIEYTTSHPVQDASGSQHASLICAEDMAGWRATVEEPVSYRYRGLDVHKCSSWTQGPVFLQQLAILEGYDLKSMGFASVDYIHTWVECAKLAFADREAYYGDPYIDDVPLNVLLSPEYAARRSSLIGERASMDLRPGDVGGGVPDFIAFDVLESNRRGLGVSHNCDTTQLDVADSWGNMVSATPSGGWIQSSPVIPGLGFCLGTRAQMFYLDPRRPSALAPHKRPRTTLTPTLVTRDSEPYFAFGTPGGDSQDQWTLQFFLNIVDFGMDLQSALDAPHFDTAHFPSSFYPRSAFPGKITLDERITQSVVDGLEKLGHRIVRSHYAGLKMMAVEYDRANGVIRAGVCTNPTAARAAAW